MFHRRSPSRLFSRNRHLRRARNWCAGWGKFPTMTVGRRSASRTRFICSLTRTGSVRCARGSSTRSGSTTSSSCSSPSTASHSPWNDPTFRRGATNASFSERPITSLRSCSPSRCCWKSSQLACFMATTRISHRVGTSWTGRSLLSPSSIFWWDWLATRVPAYLAFCGCSDCFVRCDRCVS